MLICQALYAKHAKSNVTFCIVLILILYLYCLYCFVLCKLLGGGGQPPIRGPCEVFAK